MDGAVPQALQGLLHLCLYKSDISVSLKHRRFNLQKLFDVDSQNKFSFIPLVMLFLSTERRDFTRTWVWTFYSRSTHFNVEPAFSWLVYSHWHKQQQHVTFGKERFFPVGLIIWVRETAFKTVFRSCCRGQLVASLMQVTLLYNHICRKWNKMFLSLF